MSEIREVLRVNLKKKISESSYNQKEIANALNTTPAAVSQWVNGKNSPDIEMIAKLCILLDVSFSELIGQQKEVADINQEQLLFNYNSLNELGKTKLLEYSEDLITSGNYKQDEQKQKRA